MRDELIASLKRVLSAHEDVVVAYLFGSAARDERRASSDVDVAVFIDAAPGAVSNPPSLAASNLADGRPRCRQEPVCPLPPRPLASLRPALQADLQEAVRSPVDLVILNHASPDLIHRVLRDGVLLIERDPSARIRFEVNARNAYFDVLPFLIRYREAALR